MTSRSSSNATSARTAAPTPTTVAFERPHAGDAPGALVTDQLVVHEQEGAEAVVVVGRLGAGVVVSRRLVHARADADVRDLDVVRVAHHLHLAHEALDRQGR